MFKKKEVKEPEKMPENPTQELNIGKDKQEPKEVTLEEALIGMTEIEYKAYLLRLMDDMNERLKVIEREATRQ